MATPDRNAAPSGSGYVFPLIGSIVLTLVWGGYMIWDVFEIMSHHP